MKKSQLVPFFTHIADMISVGVPLKDAVPDLRGRTRLSLRLSFEALTAG